MFDNAELALSTLLVGWVARNERARGTSLMLHPHPLRARSLHLRHPRRLRRRLQWQTCGLRPLRPPAPWV